MSVFCEHLAPVVYNKALGDGLKGAAWSEEGFFEAVRMLLVERNTLFDSLIGKLLDYPKLSRMIRTLLFTGRTFSYAADGDIMDIASMFGFIKNQDGKVAIANRIFETRLYNYYLSENELWWEERGLSKRWCK